MLKPNLVEAFKGLHMGSSFPSPRYSQAFNRSASTSAGPHLTDCPPSHSLDTTVCTASTPWSLQVPT